MPWTFVYYKLEEISPQISISNGFIYLINKYIEHMGKWKLILTLSIFKFSFTEQTAASFPDVIFIYQSFCILRFLLVTKIQLFGAQKSHQCSCKRTIVYNRSVCRLAGTAAKGHPVVILWLSYGIMHWWTFCLNGVPKWHY